MPETLESHWPIVLGLSLVLHASAAAQLAAAPRAQRLHGAAWIDFNKNGKKDPYEDPGQPLDRRIEDLLARMTLDEKTCQLATLYGYSRVLQDELPTPKWKQAIWKDGIGNIDEHLNGVYGANFPKSKLTYPPSSHAEALNTVQRWFVEQTRLGIPVDFTNEGIRGVAHDRATSFPAQLGVASAWDRRLVEAIGTVTGREARALGYTNVYSPILDLPRDPRWGRTVEAYSEDPYLTAELGKIQVKALQSMRVVSTPKHFAVYSVPKGGRDGTARTDPQVTPRELEMIYLAPFRAAIQGAGALGVMSSYNDYDAVPITANRYFLTDILRTRWGFKGYVVSDSEAVEFLESKHRVAEDYPEAVRQIPYNFPFKRGSQIPNQKLNSQEKKSMVNGALYPFGHGLSYTTYRYSNLEISPAVQAASGTVQVSLDVENSGRRAGDEIVQLYVSPEVTSVVYYDKVLRGFERVSLQPGEKKRIRFTLGPDDLMLLDRDMHWAVEPGRFEVLIGASSEDIRLRGNFEVSRGSSRH